MCNECDRQQSTIIMCAHRDQLDREVNVAVKVPLVRQVYAALMEQPVNPVYR